MSDLFIQAAIGTDGGATSTASLTGVAAGSTLVAFLFDGATQTDSGLSVSDGVAYTGAASSSPTTSPDNVFGRIFYRENVSSGNYTIVGTTGASNATMIVAEIGSSGTGVVSGSLSAMQANPSTSTDALTSGTVTITGAATLLCLSCDTSIVNATDEPIAGTGFTQRATGSGTSGNIGSFTLESKAASSDSAGTATAARFNDNYITAAIAILNAAAASGPTIDTQPQNVTVYQGQTANFSISATTSGGTLHYQWKQGVSNIGTDSNALAISPTVLADNGTSITCDVSDDNGTTTSGAAILTVIPTGITAWIRA